MSIELNSLIKDYRKELEKLYNSDNRVRSDLLERWKKLQVAITLAGVAAIIGSILIKTFIAKIAIIVMVLISEYISEGWYLKKREEEYLNDSYCKDFSEKRFKLLKDALVVAGVISNNDDKTANIFKIKQLIDILKLECNNPSVFLQTVEGVSSPIKYFVIPAILLFLENLTENQTIVNQAVLLLNLIGVVLMGSLLIGMMPSIREIKNIKYIDFISDLKTLVAFYM